MSGLLKKGYSKEYGEQFMEQLKGFSEYGFPESHAASFAHLVYASSWIKKYYPAHFTAALLNSQPMGFYSPSQLIRDLESHGLPAFPIDISYSAWDTLLEENGIRLGLHLIKGIREEDARNLVQTIKQNGRFSTLASLWFAVKKNYPRFSRTILERVAHADGFTSMGLSRRRALWEIRSFPYSPGVSEISLSEPGTKLKIMPLQEEMFKDYQTTGLSLKSHPLAFIRPALHSKGVLSSYDIKNLRIKGPPPIITVAGLSVVRQRPGTSNGIVFLTLEDETGIINLIIRPKIFELYSKIIMMSSVLQAKGRLERVNSVTHLNVFELTCIQHLVMNDENGMFPVLTYSY